VSGTGNVPSGTCFGYAVHSSIPFRYLRGGDGEALHVEVGSRAHREDTVPILRWDTPQQPYRARLYENGSGYKLWIDAVGWFGIHPEERRIEIPESSDPLRREERAWGLPSLLCFMHRGDLPLHAAAVDVGGGALLFAGPRMSGKTTLAAVMARAGYRVLAEDLSCLRLAPEPAIVPGPAMLRVRHDVAESLGWMDAGHPRSHDRVHVALPPETRGTCDPVPVRGIVFLRPSDDGISLERVSATDALRDVWALSFHLPTDADRARSFAGIADLVSCVPVWDLSRPKRFDALTETVDRLVDVLARSG